MPMKISIASPMVPPLLGRNILRPYGGELAWPFQSNPPLVPGIAKGRGSTVLCPEEVQEEREASSCKSAFNGKPETPDASPNKKRGAKSPRAAEKPA